PGFQFAKRVRFALTSRGSNASPLAGQFQSPRLGNPVMRTSISDSKSMLARQADSEKSKHFFSPDRDGLKQRWRGVWWMNSPYGSALLKWAEAYTESLRGATVVSCAPPLQI